MSLLEYYYFLINSIWQNLCDPFESLAKSGHHPQMNVKILISPIKGLRPQQCFLSSPLETSEKTLRGRGGGDNFFFGGGRGYPHFTITVREGHLNFPYFPGGGAPRFCQIIIIKITEITQISTKNPNIEGFLKCPFM